MNGNILLVGVGGQGTILAAKLLTLGLTQAGCDVKMSEIHGMSQRGGSVSSHIRYGREVFSPVIERGGADILVAFERMESLRWLPYLKPEGRVIVNDCAINPLPVSIGKAQYPATVLDTLRSLAAATVIEADREAEALGNAKVMNVVLLGAVVKIMKLTGIDWPAIIKGNVKPAFADLNARAFQRGLELA